MNEKISHVLPSLPCSDIRTSKNWKEPQKIVALFIILIAGVAASNNIMEV
jgi:hypothetical protein